MPRDLSTPMPRLRVPPTSRSRNTIQVSMTEEKELVMVSWPGNDRRLEATQALDPQDDLVAGLEVATQGRLTALEQ